MHDCAEAVRVLLEAGADKDAADNVRGLRSLHIHVPPFLFNLNKFYFVLCSCSCRVNEKLRRI